MRKIAKIKIGEDFKPAMQFKKLCYIYMMLIILFCVLTWYVPMLVFAPFIMVLGFSILLLAIFSFTLYWIPKYYDTVVYKLTENEIVWKRGVWFKQTGIVPYNRITNIGIIQGPFSRMLGIGALNIQTAGFSGQARAEIKIDGIEGFEELRGLIMEFTRDKKPMAVETAVETYEEGDINTKVLNELVKIRKLLEKSSGN